MGDLHGPMKVRIEPRHPPPISAFLDPEENEDMIDAEDADEMDTSEMDEEDHPISNSANVQVGEGEQNAEMIRPCPFAERNAEEREAGMEQDPAEPSGSNEQ